MTRIALWFDGGGEHGIGNVLRSRELGARLTLRGHTVTLRPLSARAAALAGLPAEAADRTGAAEVVVLDLPYDGDARVAEARQHGARVLALDHQGALAPDEIVSLQAVRPVPANVPHHIGGEYAIVRAEFLRLREAMPPRTDELLVILGGGDGSGLAEQVVERLVDLQCTPTLVLGPAAAEPSAALRRSGVSRAHAPADLAERMARCHWAVCTGGTTMLEFMCLGRAVHVVPRTAAEQVFADHFASQGALLGVGLDALCAPSRAGIDRCEQRGPALIDGRGCERIASRIEALAAG